MTKVKMSAGLTGAVLVCLCFTGSVYAQKVKWHKQWEFDLAPFYLWAVGIDGEQTIGPKTTGIEVKLEDIFDTLNAAFTGHFEGMDRSHIWIAMDLGAVGEMVSRAAG